MIIDSPHSAGRYDIGDEAGETPGQASAGVQARIENGDLEAACAASAEEATENFLGFFPRKAAGVPVVDGRHQIVVENIDVEVHPEPLGTWSGDRG
jgi:hypothetical protein